MINVFRGNTVNLDLNARTDGEPANLTGYTILFTVKPQGCGEDETDSSAIIKKEFVLSGTPTVLPQATLFLDESDTDYEPKDYLFDTKYFVGNQIVNSTSGIFRILQPVTNRDVDDES